mmetsp:Transcript_3637/g.6193  ORF Transcript_3637/g.6193 Transcript_3637/m.6193 type:complete len:193 (-) Transcript_3637:937-1515(-)
MASIRHQIAKQYLALKVREMFDFVYFLNANNYEQEQIEQMPLINDLSELLQAHESLSYQEIARQVKQQIQDRLLLPWISTDYLVNFYIQIIKVFKLVDPSTLLLQIVQQPIKAYLRQRNDTLKCVVQLILNEQNQEIYQQFGNQFVSSNPASRSPLSASDADDDGYISTDEDEEAASKWEPIKFKNIRASSG